MPDWRRKPNCFSINIPIAQRGPSVAASPSSLSPSPLRLFSDSSREPVGSEPGAVIESLMNTSSLEEIKSGDSSGRVINYSEHRMAAVLAARPPRSGKGAILGPPPMGAQTWRPTPQRLTRRIVNSQCQYELRCSGETLFFQPRDRLYAYVDVREKAVPFVHTLPEVRHSGHVTHACTNT